MESPRIGLQISQLEYGYAQSLIDGVKRYCTEHKISLQIFVGSNWQNPYHYESQRTVIYKYISPANIDALVIATGTLCNFISKQQLQKHLRTIGNIPAVSIAIPIDTHPCVDVDNRSGLIQLLSHLTDVHNCTRMAVMTGPPGNDEAAERLEVFRTFVEERDMWNPDLVMRGDFFHASAKRSLNAHLDNYGLNFDALVCLNDDMAIASLQVLTERGMNVPNDVVVTGFDNHRQAAFSNPPLTTVAQPLEEQAYQATSIAHAQALGITHEQPGKLPTYFVPRVSCGCLSQQVSEIINPADCVTTTMRNTPACEKLRAAGKLLLENTPDFHKFGQQIQHAILGHSAAGGDATEWREDISAVYNEHLKATHGKPSQRNAVEKGFQIARNLVEQQIAATAGFMHFQLEHHMLQMRTNLARLSSVLTLETLSEELEPLLRGFDIASAAVVIYDQQNTVTHVDTWKIPARAKVLVAYDESGAHNDLQGQFFKPRQQMLPTDIFSSRPRTLMAFALHHRDTQFGFFVFEPGKLDGSIYEILGNQLAGSVRSSTIFTAKQEAEAKLRTILAELRYYNRQLSDLSETDELTKIFNRRGFLKHAQQELRIAEQSGQNAFILYIDLDDLKQINDTWGHDAGDLAIEAAANILQQTFRSNDIIGRLGGDEFAVVASTPELGHEVPDRMQTRLQHYTDNYNHESDKPYTISMSLGAVALSQQNTTDIEALLAMADRRQYANKQKKKRR